MELVQCWHGVYVDCDVQAIGSTNWIGLDSTTTLVSACRQHQKTNMPGLSSAHCLPWLTATDQALTSSRGKPHISRRCYVSGDMRDQLPPGASSINQFC